MSNSAVQMTQFTGVRLRHESDVDFDQRLARLHAQFGVRAVDVLVAPNPGLQAAALALDAKLAELVRQRLVA